MNRKTPLAPIRVALGIASVALSISAALAASSGGVISDAPSLASVQWAGPGVSLDNLKGKTTVVMPFVTWCPKCNVWAPEMIEQVKKAIEGKPVVLVAVATDVDAAQGRSFIVKKGLTGPNVVYGANPKMNEELGLDPANLWNYIWIDREGKVRNKGAAGSFFPQGEKKEYALARQIDDAKDLGKLQFVSAGMSPAIKDLVWPIELGNMAAFVKVSQPKNLRGLAKEDQQALQDMSTRFLDEQLAAAKELASGDVPKKIEGFNKASQIGAAFASTSQGKEAKKIVLDLNGDAGFRKELAARRLYDQSVVKSGGDDARLTKALHVVVLRYPDTFYGDLAKQKIDGAAK